MSTTHKKIIYTYKLPHGTQLTEPTDKANIRLLTEPFRLKIKRSYFMVDISDLTLDKKAFK